MFKLFLFSNIMICSGFFENLIKQHKDIIAFHMEIENVFDFVESNNSLKSNEKIRFISMKLNLETLINHFEIARFDAEDEHDIFENLEDVSILLRMLGFMKSIFNEIKLFRKFFTYRISKEHLIIVDKVDILEKQFTDLKIKFVDYCRSKDGDYYYSSSRKNNASPREFDRISIN